MTRFLTYSLALLMSVVPATPTVLAADLTNTQVSPSTYNKQTRAQRFTEVLNNGSTTLDNGMIVKWGTAIGVTAIGGAVVFNTPFPTKLLSVNAQVVQNGVSVDAQAVMLNAVTTAGFLIQLQCFTFAISCVAGANIRWTATGY